MKGKRIKRIIAAGVCVCMLTAGILLPKTTASVEAAEERVSYTRDFKNGCEGFQKVSGNGTMTAEKDAVVLTGDGIFVDQNSLALKDQEVEFTYDPLNNNCNYGVILRYVSPQEYFYVGPEQQNSQHYTTWGIYGPNGKLMSVKDSAFILEGRIVPYKVKVRAVDNVVTIYVDNEEIYNGEVGITVSAGRTGFRTTANTGMRVQKFTQQTAVRYETVKSTQSKEIRSDEMTVKMDAQFPRVEEYRLYSGETLKGQILPLHQVEINNTVYTPQVSAVFSQDKATYSVSVQETGISFDVVFRVDGHVLSMNVENVKEKDMLLYTLNFPRHSLVSMSGSEAGAQLRVNNYQAETRTNLASAKATESYGETTLAVLSSDRVAAAVSGKSYKNRHEIAYQTFASDEGAYTGLWVNEYTYRGLDGEKMYDPQAKVSVTTDRNRDGKVDYQDGAIALRDDCMERKIGADTTAGSWNMIAMNVASEAQYPFLRILDNAKKVSLATDNFSQNIIIKGYQSEGHDSSHPDFANYNKRAGGLEDFNTLLEHSEEYNTKIGIHVNHTDVYPEAPQYDALATDLAAWSWYDSASQIIRENDDLDKSVSGLDGRFAQLFDTDTKGNIDTVYVDVFFGTRWPMYKLIENINGNGREMALGTEYVDEMVSHSVFAHHVGSDFGGAGNLVRIIDNGQADIFAYHQLFRGSSSRANDDVGINGWQTAKNLNNALQAFYERILPQKFLAQFPIMQYATDNKAVLGENNEVVTEMKNGVNVITKDGHEVAVGTEIFIPWEKDGEKEGKIYHWNPTGGTSVWTLPNSWSGVSSVVLYKLSDEGKEKVGTLPVSANQVQITAEAKTGYVLYKKEAADIQTARSMEWSTGSPVKDMGFDSHDFENWKPSSKSAADTKHIVIENNSLGNSHLYIKGTNDGKVSQVLDGLKKGQTYAASVWCITDDGRKASIEIQNGDETVSNYMNRSNVAYGVHHCDKYQTMAQRMQVRFTAKGTTAVLTLSAEAGSSEASVVDFDDVRVVETEADRNPDPKKYLYWEDFENVDQGWGVFVSPESDQTHLSQKNPVNPANTPDVIDGNYSLKVRSGNYIRTLPSTVRLEPETAYTVGIDYKSPSAGAFVLAVKSDRAQEAGDTQKAVVASAVAEGREGSLSLKFETGDYDDYYIDITKNQGVEYYIDNFYVEGKRPVNEETLAQLIEEAAGFKEDSYTPTSYARLKKAREDAERLLEQKPSREQMSAAYEELEEAIEALDAYIGKAQMASFQKTVDEMKQLWREDYLQDGEWLLFQFALREADRFLSAEKIAESEMKEMESRLNEAKDVLNPVVDRTALKEIIKKAERVERSAIEDGQELQTFLSGLERAKAADQKQGVTKEEIAQAAQLLTEAYEKIMLKAANKAGLIASGLEKIQARDVTEEYFIEEDWEEITAMKERLIGLQERENVKAMEYYDILDRLEGVLANRLATPVIPSAAEISPAEFVVTTNTQQPLSADNSGPVELAFDQNPETFWHSAWSGFTVSSSNPAWVQADMKKIYPIQQFSYQQRPIGGDNGKIQKYNLYVKETEDQAWSKVISDGTFANLDGVQKVKFAEIKARYVKIEVTQGAGNFASAAEFAIYQTTSDFSSLQRLMDEIGSLDESRYTKNSFAAMQKLYAEAVTLTGNLTAEQNSIDALTEQLKEAKNALLLLADNSDRGMLEDAVLSAREIHTDQLQNTEAFSKALKNAEEILSSLKSGKETGHEEVVRSVQTLYGTYANMGLKLVLKPSSPEGVIGGTVKVSAVFEPGNSTVGRDVNWSVSDRSVAQIDGNGTLKALWPGETTITAQVGNYSAQCQITVAGTEKIYRDVHSSDWYYEAANWAYINGIMSGYGNGLFGPADSLVRAQFALILYRIAGEPEVQYKEIFPDVRKNDFYANAVIWAYENQIITGYSDRKVFGAADNITREQMATILCRYVNSLGIETSTAQADMSGFPDADRIQPFAKESMNWAVAAELIKGDKGYLKPQGNANRAEAATIIRRFKDWME